MFYPELVGPALEAYRAMYRDLKTKAMRELNLAEDQIVLRELRPADFEFGSTDTDYKVGLTAVTWTTIISSKTIGDNRFVGINGFYVVNSSTQAVNNENVDLKKAGMNHPTVSQVRITRKGSVARYYVVEPIAMFANNVGWTDEPVTIDQNTTVTIDGLARYAGSLQGRFNILGLVAEKRGILINP